MTHGTQLLLVSLLVVSLQSEVISLTLNTLLGGMSVAFKNAMMGGVILALIEGVSTIVTSIAMRR